jgi:ribonuclease III
MKFLSNVWNGIRGLLSRSGVKRLEDLKVDVERLQKKIGVPIHNPGIYTQALLHRSYLANGKPRISYKSNERLEFFGDSILSMVVSEYLYERFPHSDEGHLTKLRSRLINKRALAYFADQIDLLDFIFVSPSARQSIEQGYNSLVADAYEAIIAAIYIDAGYDAVAQFVRKQVAHALDHEEIQLLIDDNYKSLLIEFTQGSGMGTPRYEVIKKEGPDHDQVFTVEVRIDRKLFGTGVGKSKKEAEQKAASIAYASLVEPAKLDSPGPDNSDRLLE